jgi:hypothetical protein
VRLCDEQERVDTIVNAFEKGLRGAYAEQLKESLDALSAGKERDNAEKKMVDKKMGDVMLHVRALKNKGYGEVQWDPEYKRTDIEEKVWQTVSVQSKQQARAANR